MERPSQCAIGSHLCLSQFHQSNLNFQTHCSISAPGCSAGLVQLDPNPSIHHHPFIYDHQCLHHYPFLHHHLSIHPSPSIRSSITVHPSINVRISITVLILCCEGNLTDDRVRYAALPRETVCTENFTPWKKLLPCDDKVWRALDC